ncbi:MAG: ester cyclase [Pseudomonadota bacterium]
MKHTGKMLASASMALTLLASSAWAGDRENIQAFYDVISTGGADAEVAAFMSATADDWESVGNYSGKNKNREGFLGQIGGIGKLIPDLDWAVQEIHEAGNFFTVRSRATGTPVAPMFGVDGEGRGFDIMAIDIHEVEDGKIVRTYHVEDWAGAMQQLSGK